MLFADGGPETTHYVLAALFAAIAELYRREWKCRTDAAKDKQEGALERAKLQAQLDADRAKLHELGRWSRRVEAEQSTITRVSGTLVCDHRGMIIEWGSDLTMILQWHAHEAIGRHISLIMPPRYREHHEAAFGRAVVRGGGRDRPIEVEAQRKDGTEIRVRIVIASWTDQSGDRRFGANIKPCGDGEAMPPPPTPESVEAFPPEQPDGHGHA